MGEALGTIARQDAFVEHLLSCGTLVSNFLGIEDRSLEKMTQNIWRLPKLALVSDFPHLETKH